MKRLPVLCLTIITMAVLCAHADPVTELDYQGKILVSDVPLTGPGYFKFSIADSGGTTNFWANDGTTNGEPGAPVTNTCYNGVFNTVLGENPMTAIDPDIFQNGNDLYLRVWFSSDNVTFNEMLPAQKLVSSPYAVNADLLDGWDADEIIAASTNGVTLSGDISGTPGGGTTVDSLQGNAIDAPSPAAGETLQWDGSAWTNVPGGISGAAASNAFVKKTGDSMSGILGIDVGAGDDLVITNTGTGVAIGQAANGQSGGAAVGADAEAQTSGAAVGRQANAASFGAAVGRGADGGYYGAALGYQAEGWSNGVAIGYQAYGYNGAVAIGRSANGLVNGAAVGYQAMGYNAGAAVGSYSDGNTDGAALGYNAKAYSSGVAAGRDANGAERGMALGYQANGYNWGSAAGYSASAQNRGAALGHMAQGWATGVAVGVSASGYRHGVGVGDTAFGTDYGVGVGKEANGSDFGTALGYSADGSSTGVAVGAQSDGDGHGVALGYNANGRVSGVAAGRNSTGFNYGIGLGENSSGRAYGIAIGYQSQGFSNSVAVGNQANANYDGIALGVSATGPDRGISIGYVSDGSSTNIAIGTAADAGSGQESIAIGHNVTNAVPESARIRGTLYMDGGTALVARTAFGSGGWKTLIPLPAFDNVIFVATNGNPNGPGTIDRPFDSPQRGYEVAAGLYTNSASALVIAGGSYPPLNMNSGSVHVLGFSRPQLASLTVSSASKFMKGKQRVENLVVNGVAVVQVDQGSDVKFHNTRFEAGLQILGPRVEVQDCYATGSDGPAITVGNGSSPIEEIAIYNSSIFNADSANASLLVEASVYYFEVMSCEIVNYGQSPGLPWAAIEDRENVPLMPPQVPHLYSHNVIQGAEHGTWMGVTAPAVYDPFASAGSTICFLQNSVWGDVGIMSNLQYYANNIVYGDINNTGGGMTWGWGQAGVGTGTDAAGNTEHQAVFPGGMGSQRGFPAAWQD